MVVAEVEPVFGCESVDELTGVAVVGAKVVDGDVPGLVRTGEQRPHLVAGHAVDMDVDSDRGEVVLDDLGCPWTAGFEDAIEFSVVVAAGEASCAGDVGDERVDVAVAIPRLAGRDVHLGGRRGG